MTGSQEVQTTGFYTTAVPSNSSCEKYFICGMDLLLLTSGGCGMNDLNEVQDAVPVDWYS